MYVYSSNTNIVVLDEYTHSALVIELVTRTGETKMHSKILSKNLKGIYSFEDLSVDRREVINMNVEEA